MPYYDHHKRSIVKGLGYIALLVISDWIVSYLITKQISLSVKITVYSNLVALVIYFIHERAWNKVHWGKSSIEIDLGKKK